MEQSKGGRTELEQTEPVPVLLGLNLPALTGLGAEEHFAEETLFGISPPLKGDFPVPDESIGGQV